MSFKRILTIFIISLFFCGYIFADDTKDYSSFMDKGFVIKADASYSYSAWIPNKSYLLDYTTKGLPLAKFDAEVTFKRVFPTIRVSWETAFFDINNIGNTRGLFYEHEKNDGLKSSYNKIRGIVGLGRIFGNNFQHQYYNPWRTNSNVSLYYNRETFRIGVTPTVSGLKYCDFEETDLHRRMARGRRRPYPHPDARGARLPQRIGVRSHPAVRSRPPEKCLISVS